MALTMNDLVTQIMTQGQVQQPTLQEALQEFVNRTQSSRPPSPLPLQQPPLSTSMADLVRDISGRIPGDRKSNDFGLGDILAEAEDKTNNPPEGPPRPRPPKPTLEEINQKIKESKKKRDEILKKKLPKAKNKPKNRR